MIASFSQIDRVNTNWQRSGWTYMCESGHNKVLTFGWSASMRTTFTCKLVCVGKICWHALQGLKASAPSNTSLVTATSTASCQLKQPSMMPQHCSASSKCRLCGTSSWYFFFRLSYCQACTCIKKSRALFHLHVRVCHAKSVKSSDDCFWFVVEIFRECFA